MVKGLAELQKQSIIHERLKSENIKVNNIITNSKNIPNTTNTTNNPLLFQIKITDPLSLPCLPNT